MTKSPRAPLSIVMTPPPVLTRTTRQRCHAALRTRALVAKPVPRWEWLVYAASVIICGGYLVQMTMAWGDNGTDLAKVYQVDLH